MRTPSFGEAAPSFRGRALGGNPAFTFNAVAGKVVLLFLCGSAGRPDRAAALRAIEAERGLFDDENALFFGVSTDPADVTKRRIAPRMPGIRWFLDHDRAISTLYGVTGEDDASYRSCLLLLDHRMRVAGTFGTDEAAAAIAATRALVTAGFEAPAAPVLVVPRVFEPELCRHLIGLYRQHGGGESGFMREVDGKTVPMIDASFKRRADFTIEDENLRNHLRARLAARLLPEIADAFQFKVTRIERWIVACYEASRSGFFSAHRDNTTPATAHRRFACTINLNAEEFEGGNLRFPEFGPRDYRAPTGGAVIFSCSLLHEARPVTRGERFAFLPFFYDEEAARVRHGGREAQAATA